MSHEFITIFFAKWITDFIIIFIVNFWNLTKHIIYDFRFRIKWWIILFLFFFVVVDVVLFYLFLSHYCIALICLSFTKSLFSLFAQYVVVETSSSTYVYPSA